MIGKNKQLCEQIEILHKVLMHNQAIYHVLEKCEKLNLPEYYIGAGCVAQTVWNYQNGNPPLFGINDIDFVYFDSDLSFEAEDAMIKKIQKQFLDCPLSIDIKNQARVHIWDKEHFGYDILPFESVEDAIYTWKTTATAVGVRLCNGKLQVYASFGLNDMFSQAVRPNKVLITEQIYNDKVSKWIEKWPSLNIIPW